MNSVSNCPICHAVFIRNHRDLCPACIKSEEQELAIIKKFLKKNKDATVMEASEGTGISVERIHHFVKEKRLLVMDLPNLGYPCKKCGNLIRQGAMCNSCVHEFSGVVSELKQTQTELTDKESQHAYHVRK